MSRKSIELPMEIHNMDPNDFKMFIEQGFSNVDDKIVNLSKAIDGFIESIRADIARSRDNADRLFNMDREMRDRVATNEKEVAKKNAEQDAELARVDGRVKAVEDKLISIDSNKKFSIGNIVTIGVAILVLVVDRFWKS